MDSRHFIPNDIQLHNMNEENENFISKELKRYTDYVEYYLRDGYKINEIDKLVLEKLKESSVEKQYIRLVDLLWYKYKKVLKIWISKRSIFIDEIPIKINEELDIIHRFCTKELRNCLQTENEMFFPKLPYTNYILPNLMYHLIYTIELCGIDFSTYFSENYLFTYNCVICHPIILLEELKILDDNMINGLYHKSFKKKGLYKNSRKIIDESLFYLNRWRDRYQISFCTNRYLLNESMRKVFNFYLFNAIEHRDIILLVYTYQWYESIINLEFLLHLKDQNHAKIHINKELEIQKKSYDIMYERAISICSWSIEKDFYFKDKYFYTKKEDIEHEIDSISKNNYDDKRKFIVDEYHKFMKLQYIDSESLSAINSAYESYKQFGGNSSTMDLLIKKLHNLPNKIKNENIRTKYDSIVELDINKLIYKPINEPSTKISPDDITNKLNEIKKDVEIDIDYHIFEFDADNNSIPSFVERITTLINQKYIGCVEHFRITPMIVGNIFQCVLTIKLYDVIPEYQITTIAELACIDKLITKYLE